ncbi:TPA: hypothetical protein L9199_004812 [Klebsiella aerogenes]|nr:hypothetical protein [Klebsiella aerogenes]
MALKGIYMVKNLPLNENVRIYKINGTKGREHVMEKRKNSSKSDAKNFFMGGMSLDEYGRTLEGNNIVTLNSEGVLVESRTGIVLATDVRQLDLLIAWMETLRQQMMQ